MPWLLPSVIATMSGTALLSFVYFYLFKKDKKDYLGIWSLSWSIYFLRYVFMLLIIIDRETPFLLIANQAASLVSGIILLWGTYRFIGWKLPKIFIYLSVPGLAWIVISISLDLSFLLISLPTFTFLAAVYIWTGVSFIRSNLSGGHEKNITGWAFVIWGVHKANYPFLRPVIWFAPWGYLFGAMLELLVAIGILLVYYQKIKNDLEKERYYLKKSEQELLEINKTLKEVQSNAKIGSWWYTPETDFMTWSEEMFHIFGLQPGSEPPDYDETRRMIYPDDWELFDTAVNSALNDGIDYNIDLRITLPNGKIRYIKARGYTEKDDSGNVKKLVGSTQDITENREAREELVKSEERYRALFDNIPINTIVVDKKGKITDYKFPDNQGEIMKPGLGDVMYVDYAEYPYIDMYKELMGSIKTGKKKEYLDLKYDDKYLHIRINPYQDGAIITAVDTTPVRKLESELQQVQKIEGIGTLAGGIAHDFNNILSPIMLHTEMAMEDLGANDPLQHDMKEIYRAAKRARDLVKQILTFARKGKEDRIVLRVSLILNETIKFLRSTIPSTIDVQYYNKTYKDTVLADPTHINQIVMNLCTNAAHAMKDKGGILEIIIKNEDISDAETDKSEELKQGRYLKISVRDNGTGIPPDIMDKIFEPYYTTKQTGEGTGLGLAIIHGIVKSYGGSINVKSKSGQGTTFIVYLPLTDEEVSVSYEQKEKTAEGNERILFVDDEKTAVDASKKMLERLGYKVTGRTSSVEALEAFRNKPDAFDLVISDMTMPNMTGDVLAGEIMNISPDIPVIICTGFSDKIDEEKAKELGIRAFIMKPIVMNEMATVIRDVLDMN